MACFQLVVGMLSSIVSGTGALWLLSISMYSFSNDSPYLNQFCYIFFINLKETQFHKPKIANFDEKFHCTGEKLKTFHYGTKVILLDYIYLSLLLILNAMF